MTGGARFRPSGGVLDFVGDGLSAVAMMNLCLGLAASEVSQWTVAWNVVDNASTKKSTAGLLRKTMAVVQSLLSLSPVAPAVSLHPRVLALPATC